MLSLLTISCPRRIPIYPVWNLFLRNKIVDLFILLIFFSTDEINQSSPVIAEAVSYLTKKVDTKTRDVRILQPTIATQNVGANFKFSDISELYCFDKLYNRCRLMK